MTIDHQVRESDRLRAVAADLGRRGARPRIYDEAAQENVREDLSVDRGPHPSRPHGAASGFDARRGRGPARLVGQGVQSLPEVWVRAG